MSRRSSDDESIEVRMEDICPAGGIHDMEKKWMCTNYVSACFCCPCYLLKEIFCGWCYRNPSADDFDGIGCRPTGPEICSKCGQTSKQVKEATVLRVFHQHPGGDSSTTKKANNKASLPPQLPALSYASTPQMFFTPPPSYLNVSEQSFEQQQQQRRSFENRNLSGQNQSNNNISKSEGRRSMENQNNASRN
ncbi:8056_t:CDS:2 [Ambispora gerdemannii]|uniref:8056_t:CDS:1 n=1 Tax=Ambispora gerdemannii TaxID=144530 RepID=A0A9N8YTD7_9GLOM|nr:8056_t:CDS:2 [Ambispora gerdemannii]